MNLLLSPLFWAAAGMAVFVLMSVKDGQRTLAFGVFNLAVLAGLVGLGGAVVVLVLAVLVWAGLRAGQGADRSRPQQGVRAAHTVLVGVLVILFVCYKVSREHDEFWKSATETIPGASLDVVTGTLATISFSYVFLRTIDVTMAVGSGAAPLVNPLSLAGYLAPFHMLLAGPISGYRDHIMLDRASLPEPSLGRLLTSLNEITTGLLYKFVIAESMKTYAYGVHASVAPPAGIADTMFLLVYIFFDFAGYSRVAFGIGRLCGVPTPHNFYAPLLASSVTNFWTRWHMSLGSFVLRNIYTPIQLPLARRLGLVHARAASLLTLLLSFGFVGIWHRLSLAFFLWGLGMGAILFLEKLVRDYCFRHSLLQSRGVALAALVVGPIYVFLVISLSLRYVLQEFLGV